MYRTKGRFVRHEPCPNCGSRDNLARYADGSAWCFGCRYIEHSERTLANARQKDHDNNNNSGDMFFDDRIPRQAMIWLRQYGLTDEEIESAGFLWDPVKTRLVFPIRKDGEIVFWQGRRFGCLGPKYLSHGNIPGPIAFGSGGTVIFTEDVVSAIKVGRHAVGSPLFGSHVPASALKWAQERFSGVGVWLDPDKRKECLKTVIRGQSMGIKVVGIYSDKDPKEHTDTEIKEILWKSFESDSSKA